MPKYSQVADDDDDDDDDFSRVQFHGNPTPLVRFHGAPAMPHVQFYEAPSTTPLALDNVVINAIANSNSLMARKWAFPDATQAIVAAQGLGKLAETAFGAIIGTQLSIKEMVPMSTGRWSKFIGGSFTSAYASAIPAVGQFVAPIATGIASRAEGKGKANVARDAAVALGGSAIDSAATIATLGGYVAYTSVMAGIGTALAIFLKAKFYADTWVESQGIIQQRLAVLRSIGNEAHRASLNVRSKWETQVKFLQRQVNNCRKRGEGFGEEADKWDEEMKRRIEKLKNLGRGEESRALHEPLFPRGGQSDT